MRKRLFTWFVRLARFLWRLGLCFVQAILITVWLSTCLNLTIRDGGAKYLGWALVSICLLIFLYYTEGIENAYADLRDKEPERVERDIRDLLREMKKDELFFYAQREALSVFIVVLLTLITVYPEIYFIRWKVGQQYRLLFSMLFTSLTVLWFCQVVPKQLAIRNSERFLYQSRRIWRIMRGTRWIDPSAPCKWIVDIVSRPGRPYSRRRVLPPSRHAHYLSSLKFYGFGDDTVEEEVVIKQGGAASVRRKYSLHFVMGGKSERTGFLRMDGVIRSAEMKVLNIFKIAQPGDHVETIAKAMDAAFEGLDAGPDIERLPLELQPSVAGTGTKEVRWVLRSPQHLPEGIWSGSEQGPAVVCVVELTASVDEGGVKIDGTEDQWFLQVRWPCRKYRVQIKIAEGLALQLALPRAFVRLATREGEELHEVGEETQRFSSGIGKRLADTHTLTAQVDYPLPGMFYELYWKCWARDRILPPT